MNELSYTCTSQSIVHNIVLLINFRLEETNLFYLFCNKLEIYLIVKFANGSITTDIQIIM